MSETKFFCPKGCGRDFKSNSAAHAHAYHCKFEAPTEVDPTPDTPAAPELSPSDQAIVDRLTATILPQIEEGMAGLQERVQTNLFTGLAETIPKVVAEEVQSTAEKIVGGAKSNPGSGGTSGISSLMSMADQVNTFLETPLGAMLQKKFMGSGKSGKRSISTNWLFRGANYAQHLMLSKKLDTEGAAEFILGAAEDELRERDLPPDYRSFVIGQKNAAQRVLGTVRAVKDKEPKLKVEEKEKTE
ncbi:hypothetical protein ES703_18790 [subsurface metagenome]